MRKEIKGEYTFEPWEVSPIDDRELTIDYVGEWTNDGIGSYEFWGQVGYDVGTDYFEVTDVSWNRSEFTDEENKYLDKWVQDEWEFIQEKINEQKN